MARQRTLKMEFWADEGLACAVSRDARMLYMGLWNLADEAARCRGGARWIKGQLFAYDDDLSAADVDRLITDLERAGKVRRYRVEGETYLFLPKLAKHQRLEPDKTPSKLPDPDDVRERSIPEDSETFREKPEDLALLYCSSSLISSSVVEIPGDAPATSAPVAALPALPKQKRATRIPEDFTVTPEMTVWAKEKVPSADIALETIKFVNHWKAKGGKDALKLDWGRTWQNWMLNTLSFGGARAAPVAESTTEPSYFQPMRRRAA